MRTLSDRLSLKTHPAVAEYEWSWPFRAGQGCLNALLVLGVAAQHGELFPPGRAALLAAIAGAPGILGAFGVGVPRFLFSVLVLGATAGLLVDTVEPGQPDIAPFFLVFLAAAVGCFGTLLESAIVTGAALLVLAVSGAFGLEPTHQPWYIGVVFGWLGGVLLQHQVRLLAQLRDAHADLAEKSAADERQRITRELHDVIAHSLTVTMLHITGARRALQRDPAEAAEALEEAERLGRQSLADVRRAVGLLGRHGSNAPMPGGSDVATLVDQLSATGMDVHLDVRGDLTSLPPATGLALYRIVQESLTNAAKHAPAAEVKAAISLQDDSVTVRVSNPLPATGATSTHDGLGLWGMNERASLLGGTLDAGRRNGRWIVEATIPIAREKT